MVKLLQDVITIDDSFAFFKEMAKTVSNFYFESRYPMGYDIEYTRDEIEQALVEVGKLMALVKVRIKNTGSKCR